MEREKAKQYLQAVKTDPFSDYFIRDIEAYRPLIEYLSKDEEFVSAYGKQLAKARNLRYVTYDHLAAVVDVSHSAILKIERGDSAIKSINVDFFLCFCVFLNVSPEYLLGLTKHPTNFDSELDFSEAPEDQLAQLRTLMDRNIEEIKKERKFQDDKQEADFIKNYCESEIIADPLIPISRRAYYQTTYVVGELWNTGFELLYRMYVVSQLKVDDCVKAYKMLERTFLSEIVVPSDDVLLTYQRPQLTENSTQFEGVFKRFRIDGTIQRFFHKSNKTIRKKSPAGMKALLVLTIFESSFQRLFIKCPDLLTEFCKIASLNKQDRERIFALSNAFIPQFFSPL